MHKRRVLMAAALPAAVAGGVALTGGRQPAASAQGARPNTASVQEGKLSAVVSQDGTLSYRARPDGSPFSAINHARGTYTALPQPAETARCGHVLYRVDDKPVVLLCGTVPAFRALHPGDTGRDVRQLNRDLRVRGGGATFTAATQTALEALQRHIGARVTGSLALGDAIFLPGPLRIARVMGQLGGWARPATPVLEATSGTLQVQVNVDPSEQGQIRRGQRARVTLPGNTTVTGRVVGFGRIAQGPAGGAAAAATIPTFVALDDPGKARGLDKAPVGVDIITTGVARALSVPVTALVGRAGGGFAVEVPAAGAGRRLVAVRVGLFDDAQGRVQVEGALRAGDRVVVPSL